MLNRAFIRTAASHPDVFEFPALAELGFHVVVGLLVVGETQVLAVPQELLVRESPTDRPQQHPFRVGTSNAEVGTRRIAALAGPDPVLDRKSTRLNSSHLGISYAV